MLQKGGGEHAFPKFCFCQPFKNCNNVKFPVELKCSSLCFSEHVAVFGDKVFLDGVI